MTDREIPSVSGNASLSSQRLSGASLKTLLWLTLAAFVVGTETYMIAGLLPGIAADLGVSVGKAGQLVTAFALAYAIGSPVLATATAATDRRALLVASLGVFAAANVLAACSTGYSSLLGARMVMALAAGSFMPAAVALGGALAGAKRRGRAVALVSGGVTLAIALGSPLGTLVGAALGWRAPFLAVASLAILAAFGIQLGFPPTRDLRLPVPPLRERFAVLKERAILRLYAVCALYALSGLMVYTYLAPLTAAITGHTGWRVGLMQAVWSLGAALGIFGTGAVVDRHGAGPVGAWALALQIPGYLALSVLAWSGPDPALTIPLTVAIFLWGLSSWGYWPAHQAQLMAAAPALAPITLSVNQALMYVGISAGAALGSGILAAAPLPAAAHLGWIAAIIDFAALCLFVSGLVGLHGRNTVTKPPSSRT